MSKRYKWSTLDYDTRIDLLEFRVAGLQAELVEYKKCAENHLKAELDKHRWIPVEERLPRIDMSILWVYESGYVISIVNLLAGTDMDDFLGGTSSFGKVTHWKPIILPEQALKGIKP